MTQQGLIKKVLAAASMEDCNPNHTPAVQGALGADKNGTDMNEPWNYRSIVGMLMYLSTNTRPDISFAVSQLARFSSQPKEVHAKAVKHLLRYLKGTINEGTTVKPTNERKYQLHVDADFAGLFGKEDPRDPNSVRSRTGYIIRLDSMPVVWQSKLKVIQIF